MRAIVFSDSHGVLKNAFKALDEAGEVDLILHAGDHYRDGLKLAAETGLPVKAVLGNCDSYSEGPLEELIEATGHRILLVHGHLGGPAQWFGRLFARACGCGASTVIFGHSHTAQIIKEDGLIFFNPGSITIPRDNDRPSYGILEIDEDSIAPHIHRI